MPYHRPMPPLPALLTSALLALAFASGPQAGAAELAGPASPAARYAQGKAALEAGRFDAALEAFEAALADVDDEVTRWQLLLGVAVAHELSGHALAALESYQRFIDRAVGSPIARTPKWAERLDVARRSVATHEAAVLQTRALLVVESTSAFATVLLAGGGGEEALTPPARRYLAPGAYQVRATALGMEPFVAVLELHVGDRRRVEVALTPSPPVAPVDGVTAGVDPGGDGVHAGWWPVGVGAALIVTGAVFTGLAYADASEVERLSREPGTPDVLSEHARLTARGEDRQTASWICYGAGLAAVGAGVLWLLLDDDGPTQEATLEPYGVHFEAGPRGARATFTTPF